GRAMGMIRNGQVFLFATDQLGSVFTVADPSGNSVQEVLYDSFGRRIQNSNPEHDLALGFCGGLYDSDTGLIHFGYREYDPVIGRFISPDPLGYDGGDVDVYGYCLDDPINFTDRDGLQSSSEESGNEDSGSGGNNTASESTESKSSSSGSSARSELGGYAGYTGYSGPSFSEYCGTDFSIGDLGTNFSSGNGGAGNKQFAI
ncbi:RHS repeat-associated core domain-containing protein, partial [Marinifilum sp. JC120]